MNRLGRILCVFLLSVSSLAVAQNLGTGLYAFGSFDSRGFDSINIGNLNTHFEIPIVNKQGRGLPFNYTLAYDGLVWSTGTTTGTGTWQPDSGWGFHGVLLGGSFTGYLTHSTGTKRCPFGPDGQLVIGERTVNYRYHDPYGRVHAFDYDTQYCPGTDDAPVASGDGSTFDGSGYSYNPTDGTVRTRNGSIINAADSSSSLASGSITDSNGNSVTNNGNGSFTDTLGVTALTIGGAGSASSPLTLSYPVTLQSDSATTATVTAYYKTYTVQTNFQCSGIVEYGATSIDLMDHITLADAVSTYSFTYEPTPGVAGSVTGRLASVTLPTGGTITYTYSGGCNGSGVNPDGTVNTLKRTTTDGYRTYTTSVNSNATTTTVQDEKGNQAQYNFTIANGLFYETQREIYQGAVGGPDLLGVFTCYNGAQPPCDGAAVNPPFSQTIAVTSYNNGVQDSLQNSYDSFGMLTASVKAQWGGTPLQSQGFVYNPLEEVTQATTYDGSNNLVAQTNYGYDEIAPTTTSGIPQHSVITGTPGNQTSSSTFVGGGVPNIATSTAYYDTGVPISTTTPNGTTQYSYDSTQTFTSLTTLPTPSSGVSLATSASYDQQSGALTSATGMNAGQTAQVTQYDRLLRPRSVSYPDGGQATYSYSDVNTFWTDRTLNSGTTSHYVTHTDGYGRLDRTAVFNGQSGNPWYQVDYCYDATGLLQFQSTTYQGSGFAGANAAKQCSGSGTSYLYDALGRVTSITNADGTATTQYNGRAVKTTDVNGVQKITQYDLLGRISAICEVSSSTLQGDSPQNCGLDIAGTGFPTTYAYDLANHKTTITQGAQTRIFQTDAAGRTISISEPERGTTSYSYAYNSTGLVVTRKRPRANQTVATVLTTTTTQYDAVGRVLSISYDDGTPTKNFGYDVSANWAILNQTNLKGMLSAAVINTPGEWASSLFSYDSMGRVNAMAECLPLWCGNSPLDKRLDFNYDLTGNLTSSSDGAGATATYSYTPAGEISQISSSMSDATHPGTVVSNVQNGPNGPFIYSLGNGVSVNLTYDGLGRPIGRWVCYGANQAYAPNQWYCPGGAQLYAYLVSWQGNRTTASADSALSQGHWYGYDEFNRLTSSTVNYGTVQNFTYAYDRYGNRWQQNAPQGGPAPSYSFDKSNNQISGYSYDAVGNMTTDGFHNYIYDAEGNITHVDGTAGAFYVYNALNQRVQVDWPTVSHQYVYNAAGQRVSVWDTNTHAQVQGQYYWGSTPIAFYYNDGSLHFQHQDWMGTERVRTSYSGSTEGSYYSLPWGDGYIANGGDNDPYHFAQLDHDSESDTHHAQFRQYSSTQGRWMSPDPYDGSYDAGNPQSFNRYAYGKNNPLGRVDPSGMVDESADPCDDVTCFVGPDPVQDGSGGGGGGGCPVDACVTAPPSPPVDPNDPFQCYACFLGSMPQPGQYVPPAPNNVPSSTACQTKIANALNSNLQPNTNVMFLGPTAIPSGQMDPRLGPGGRNGAYNFNYFAPGVNNPVAGSTNGSGRFPGSGLHVPLPGGADPVIPNFGPGVYMGQTGSFLTAHFDSGNPFDDLVSFFEHIINDVLRRNPHGC